MGVASVEMVPARKGRRDDTRMSTGSDPRAWRVGGGTKSEAAASGELSAPESATGRCAEGGACRWA